MDNYTDSFNLHSDGLREKREAEDRHDYNHAQSGAMVGRQRKHLPSEEIDPITGKKKRDAIAQALQRTLEDLLANNEQYRIAHGNLMDAIHYAAEVTQTALERVKMELTDVQGNMKELLGSAAKLPDGTKVFKDKNGNVRDEDGEIIPPELALGVEWSSSQPTYEEYFTIKNRISEMENAERELRGIETEIGGIRDRATDNDKPIAQEELKPKTDVIKSLEDRAREIESNTFDKAPKHQVISEENDEHNLTASGNDLTRGLRISIGGKP